MNDNSNSEKSNLNQTRKKIKTGKYIIILTNTLAAVCFLSVYFLFPTKEILFIILSLIMLVLTLVFIFLFRYIENKILLFEEKQENKPIT